MNNSNLTDDFIYSHGSYIKFKELLCYNINRPTLSLNTIERWYAYLFINLYTSAESLKVYSILSEVMTEEFIERHWDTLDHDGVICTCNVSDDFINKHRDSISYESLIIANKQPTPTWDKAPIEWLRNNFHLIKDWRLLLRFKKLSDDLLDDIWLHGIPLDILVDFGYVTERFLYKFYRYVDLNKLMSAYHMKFTERFICDMLTLTDIDIDRVVITQILSEDFIHTFRKYLNWDLVCKYQLEQMSEEFIRKHKRYVNWSILRDSDREWSDKFYSKFLLNLLD